MSYQKDDELIALLRPVGPKELALIEQSNFSQFPQRLDGQPYFYPVRDEYASQIAREWNAQFELKTVRSTIHKEYWFLQSIFPNSIETSSGRSR